MIFGHVVEAGLESPRQHVERQFCAASRVLEENREASHEASEGTSGARVVFNNVADDAVGGLDIGLICS
eukprot:CAMPEP_0197536332 /NCGR_PEP_ID=MMETSP1318-20131121/53561_1 /TAXON_ID=552666 /ORGANISM="Partenskyella glossopodia, Strain RCC365" /LENGTH=68 /DNA_ID=CAMNT_0043094193 /DNA_START=239 /DNA_END=445 /DNA_ORIENTATION=-